MDIDRLNAPPALVDAAAIWVEAGRPAQQPMGWSTKTWLSFLPQHGDYLSRLPNPIGRDDVIREFEGVTTEHDQAVNAFLAAMVWGYGRVGYGAFRTARVLAEDENPGEKLLTAARRVRDHGGPAGFDHLRTNRLKWLGVSFATKYLYFCSAASPFDAMPALILDRVVNEWLATHTGRRLRMDWRSRDYNMYCSAISNWAKELELTAPQVEYLMFATGIGGSSQWGSAEDATVPATTRAPEEALHPEDAAVLDALDDAAEAFIALPDGLHPGDVMDFEHGIRALRRVVLARTLPAAKE